MIKISQTSPAKPEPVKRNVAQQPVQRVAQQVPLPPVSAELVRRIEALEREMAEFRKIVNEITGLPAVALKSRAEYYREYRARKKQSV